MSSTELIRVPLNCLKGNWLGTIQANSYSEEFMETDLKVGDGKLSAF